MKKWNEGFTMVELMIVATIIGILAAIAIPNFMAAQTRAKISRAKGEQEMLTIALQSYFVDRNMYPVNSKIRQPLDSDLLPLTTPIGYITRLPRDPFKVIDLPNNERFNMKYQNPNISEIRGYSYVNYLQINPKKAVMYSPDGGVAWFVLFSPGSDYDDDYQSTDTTINIFIYDPTNGTTSNGDIYVFGP